MTETFSTSSLQPLNKIKVTYQEAGSQRLPNQDCIFQADRKTRMAATDLWFAETFSTSLQLLDRIQQNLTGSKISTSSTKFTFFRANQKNQDDSTGFWLAETFRLLCTDERNSTKLDRTHRPPCLCFWADRKPKMAALASGWLRHFRLLYITKRNVTEASTKRPLSSFFSGHSGN